MPGNSPEMPHGYGASSARRARYALLLIGGLLLILCLTLFPYQFQASAVREGLAARIVVAWINIPADFFLNIILFIPFGMGLMGLVARSGSARVARSLLVLGACILLSLGVEMAQLFLPTRIPSTTDLLANGLGALAGILLVQFFGGGSPAEAGSVGRRLEAVISVRVLSALLVVYVLALPFVMRVPAQSLSFANWDASFALLLGNERTGDRPWRGHVSDLAIWDRALSRGDIQRLCRGEDPTRLALDNLVCRFRLGDGGGLSDDAGHLADLVWQGGEESAADGPGTRLDDGHWLRTATPAVALSRALRQSSQFTLAITAASSDSTQTGPARIVSLSADPYQRNFTLGQQETGLVFRLRTPLTGDNGNRPELVVPDIFRDSRPHRYYVTYDGNGVLLFVDDVARSFALELKYGAVLQMMFSRFSPDDMLGYKVIYHGIFALPLVALGIMLLRRWRLISQG